MSNEFEVHNFYNHSIEELEDIKSECAYLCDSAIWYKKGESDLEVLTKDEWYAKYDGCPCDDDQLYEMAHDKFGGELHYAWWEYKVKGRRNCVDF